jgi:hypothetical protein
MRGSLTFCPEDAVVIAEVPGDQQLESRMHKRFARWRVDLPGRNEIFEDCAAIRNMLASAPALAKDVKLDVQTSSVASYLQRLSRRGPQLPDPERVVVDRGLLEENCRLMQQLALVNVAQCNADEVLDSWRSFGIYHRLSPCRIETSDPFCHPDEVLFRWETAGDSRVLSQTAGWMYGAEYIARSQPSELPFAWLWICLRNETETDNGDPGLAWKFNWLRELCEARAGRVECNGNVKNFAPCQVSYQTMRLPPELISWQLFLRQCWIAMVCTLHDFRIRVSIGSAVAQDDSRLPAWVRNSKEIQSRAA